MMKMLCKSWGRSSTLTPLNSLHAAAVGPEASVSQGPRRRPRASIRRPPRTPPRRRALEGAFTPEGRGLRSRDNAAGPRAPFITHKYLTLTHGPREQQLQGHGDVTIQLSTPGKTKPSRRGAAGLLPVSECHGMNSPREEPALSELSSCVKSSKSIWLQLFIQFEIPPVLDVVFELLSSAARLPLRTLTNAVRTFRINSEEDFLCQTLSHLHTSAFSSDSPTSCIPPPPLPPPPSYFLPLPLAPAVKDSLGLEKRDPH
ncbi:hypothetical protein EYF80_035684 [Liparis tanakae]|uniref:Uncharacterized protein n=1 Tax=Liparis tanakae TaxID=230148 RepID=A0A4Z2GLH9_9TELE|nr:hypothetical protein EYF80_035684 [Liparis tanakae]